MAFFSTKTKTPTHTERLAGLAAKKEASLSVFAAAAQDLETVADEAAEVYNDIEFQIGHLQEVRDAAAVERAAATEKAALIRSTFVGG